MRFLIAAACVIAPLIPPRASADASDRAEIETTVPVVPPRPAARVRGRALRVPLPESAGPIGENGTLALPNLQSETVLAVSGTAVVVGFNDFRGTNSFSGAMYSSDGGATFADAGTLPAPNGTAVNGDPALAVYEPLAGPPVFYFSSLYAPGPGLSSLCIHRSIDGGASWEGPFEITPATSSTEFQDKEWCTVDPETGRLLVSWTRFLANGANAMMVTYSDDGGMNWSAPESLGTMGQGTVIACDPDGPNIYLAWRSTPALGFRAFRLARSLDNGGSWLPAEEISPWFLEILPPYGFDRFNSFPRLAVNPADGGVELVYAASENGTPAGDFGDVYHRRSTDDGQSFSAPVAINAFPGTDRPQAFPEVTAADDGRIDVFWYDESAGSGVSDVTDLFYTFSSDFGATWSSPVPLTPSPFHNEAGNDNGAPHQGDYIDAVAGSAVRVAFAWFGEPSPLGTSPDAMVTTIPTPTAIAALRVRPGTVGVDDHGCAADDGLLVAGETAFLTLPLENFGRVALTGITATLTALTPAITVLSAMHGYPSLTPGSSAAGEAFVIRLSDSYPCGATARLRLDIAANGVSPTFVELTFPTGVVVSAATLLAESFDGVGAPALPAGWSTMTGCSGCAPNPWLTAATTPDSPPNAAFCSGESGNLPSFGRLVGPTVAVPPGTDLLEVSFDVQYDLEQRNDRVANDAVSFGYQLNGAGGTRFATADAREFDHRYTHYVVRGSGSGAGDRSGWSGSSAGYRRARILIPDMAGSTLTPRFELSTVGNAGPPGNTGAWIDDFEVRALGVGCGPCTPTAVAGGAPELWLRCAGANPFQGGTTLSYRIPELARVRIEVFSVAGRRVRTLVDEVLPAGIHAIRFDLAAPAPGRLAPGIYFARLTSDAGARRTLRLVALH